MLRCQNCYHILLMCLPYTVQSKLCIGHIRLLKGHQRPIYLKCVNHEQYMSSLFGHHEESIYDKYYRKCPNCDQVKYLILIEIKLFNSAYIFCHKCHLVKFYYVAKYTHYVFSITDLVEEVLVHLRVTCLYKNSKMYFK